MAKLRHKPTGLIIETDVFDINGWAVTIGDGYETYAYKNIESLCRDWEDVPEADFEGEEEE